MDEWSDFVNIVRDKRHTAKGAKRGPLERSLPVYRLDTIRANFDALFENHYSNLSGTGKKNKLRRKLDCGLGLTVSVIPNRRLL